MRILVAGGSGFIGKNLIKRIAEKNEVYYLSRKRSPEIDSISKFVFGDITKDETLKNLPDVDVVIDLVAVIKETKEQGHEDVNVRGVKNLLNAYEGKKIKFVYFSAINADIGKTKYFQTKFMAENMVKNSGFDYLIIRPSLVFGKDDYFTKIVKKVSKYGFSIKSGYLCPVYVEDLVSVVSILIEKENGIFEISGPEKLTLKDLVDIDRKNRGKKESKIISDGIFKIILPFLSLSGIITKEQFYMLKLDFCRDQKIWERFGIKPKKFSEIYEKI